MTTDQQFEQKFKKLFLNFNHDIVLELCEDTVKHFNVSYIQEKQICQFVSNGFQPTKEHAVRLARRIHQLMVQLESYGLITPTKQGWVFTDGHRVFRKYSPRQIADRRPLHLTDYTTLHMDTRDKLVLDSCKRYVKETKIPYFTAYDVFRHPGNQLGSMAAKEFGWVLQHHIRSPFQILIDAPQYLKFLFAGHTGGYLYKFDDRYVQFAKLSFNSTRPAGATTVTDTTKEPQTPKQENASTAADVALALQKIDELSTYVHNLASKIELTDQILANSMYRHRPINRVHVPGSWSPAHSMSFNIRRQEVDKTKEFPFEIPTWPFPAGKYTSEYVVNLNNCYQHFTGYAQIHKIVTDLITTMSCSHEHLADVISGAVNQITRELSEWVHIYPEHGHLGLRLITRKETLCLQFFFFVGAVTSTEVKVHHFLTGTSIILIPNENANLVSFHKDSVFILRCF